MSKFFKALEQAERERALRERDGRPDPKPAADAPDDAPDDVRPEPVAGAAAPAPVSAPPVAVAEPVVERVAEPIARPVAEPVAERVAAPIARTVARPVAKPVVTTALEREEPRMPVGAAAGHLGGVEGHLVSLLNPGGVEAEQYRALRHLIEQLRKSANLCVLAISSPAAGDGKTTTVINLAGALAQDPKARILLVDADLRASAIDQRLDLGSGQGPGLVGAILDPALPLAEVIRPCPPFSFKVLPVGRRPSAPYELLGSSRFLELLDEARRQFDYVLVDSPPMLPFPDCRVIEKSVDGLLLVVAAHKTPRKLLEESLHVMDSQKVVGLVFNGDDRPMAGYYYGYYTNYGPVETSNGNSPGWLRKAVTRVGGSFRRRRSSRSLATRKKPR